MIAPIQQSRPFPRSLLFTAIWLGVLPLQGQVDFIIEYHNLISQQGFAYDLQPPTNLPPTGSSVQANRQFGVVMLGDGGFLEDTQAILDPGISHRYRFEGAQLVLDSVGGVNPTATAAPTADTVNKVEGDSSIAFNGSSQYLAFDTSSYGSAFPNYTLTLHFRATRTSGIQVLFEEGNDARGIALRLNGTTLEGRVEDPAGNITVTGPTISADQWYFAALRFQSGQLTLTVDDTHTSQSGAAFSVTDHTGARACIGGSLEAHVWGDVDGPTSLFQGQIDDLRVYRSSRLDDVRIAQIRNFANASNPSGISLIYSFIGGLYDSSVPDLYFGDEIVPPTRKGDGAPLTLDQIANGYWRPEPVRAVNRADGTAESFFDIKGDGQGQVDLVANNAEERFYYSPFAEKVYASSSGRILLHWIAISPDTNGEYDYLTETYNISSGTGSSTTQRSIFWTVGGFNGPVVKAPKDRISQINIVYNDQVPREVDLANRYDPPGSELPIDERRTLWLDTLISSSPNHLLHAYNVEGKVFIEYLRQNPLNLRIEQVGREVVALVRSTSPKEINVSLGEIVPPDDVDVDFDLLPQIVNPQAPYFQQHQINRGVDTRYFAVSETNVFTEALIWWLELDSLGTGWPKYYRGYNITWPDTLDVTMALPPSTIDPSTTPGVIDRVSDGVQLVYQDNGAASIVESSRFQVQLESGETENRSLLRVQNGKEVWYLRVRSTTNESVFTSDTAQVAVNALVGSRINPPAGITVPAGYILEPPGALLPYQQSAYLNPFSVGFEAAAKGAIIPVNALSGNNTMEIWWFTKVAPPSGLEDDFGSLYFPTKVGRYTLQWPNLAADPIVIAQGNGTGDLPQEQAVGTIYTQNDPAAIGFNPNEEHALMIAGRAYALRDDLNLATTSQPYALLSYTALDGRPNMRAFRVIRELDANNNGNLLDLDPDGDGIYNEPGHDITFRYNATAGQLLQAPAPLSLLPLPMDEDENVFNFEVTPSGQDDATGFTAGRDDDYAYYNSFTFRDRKGNHWIYRGPHAGTGVKELRFKFAYVSQPGFYDTVNSTEYTAGTILPFLRAGSPGAWTGNTKMATADLTQPAASPALTITYVPTWPTNPPSLKVAETLTLPKNGLPAVRGQSSAQILYEQSIGLDMVNKPRSVLLFDPTRDKTADLEEIPPAIATTTQSGKTYFQLAPPQLRDRFFWDPTRGTDGQLVLRGKFVDAPTGDDYLLLNTLSPEEIATLKGLHPSSPSADKTAWDAAIDALSTKVENFVESSTVPGTYVAGISRTYGESELPEILDSDDAADSYALTGQKVDVNRYVTLLFGDGEAFTPIGDPVALQVFRVVPTLYDGELKLILSPNPLDETVSLRHSGDFSARAGDYTFEWKYQPPVNGLAPAKPVGDNLGNWLNLANPTSGLYGYLWGGSGILTLADNYVTMRYRHTATTPAAWSEWTEPQLVEGWVKRVLAGINPFDQRIKDFYNNSIDTDVSILTQAGPRWEGDIALSLESINDFGLIEIYETVFNRAKSISIDGTPPTDYGPANDALLLVTGYLSDLYTVLGDEAYADALNPTIAFDGQAISLVAQPSVAVDFDSVFQETATARFAFQNQVASLLEEELTLLRGRDNQTTTIKVNPAYNRFYWNFTGGINAGEVIYALNYNIREKSDENADGAVDALDALRMYPQGHGDAYGHYLTGLKYYYDLLIDPHFSWQPRTEAVLVLGQAVQVDYLDERKFAALAADVTRVGLEVLELEHRRVYREDPGAGWSHLGESLPTKDGYTRHWGVDEWAARTGQGAWFHWLVANSVIPALDTVNEGIQKIDRTTVVELAELSILSENIQAAMDAANARLNPLGLSPNSMVFDISPSEIDQGRTHYEQVFDRALRALDNSFDAFDRATANVRLIRGLENQVDELAKAISDQERSFTYQLIDLYGTPYSGDIGPGKLYSQGYDGADLIHYYYLDARTFRPTITEPDDAGEIESIVVKIDSNELQTSLGSYNYDGTIFESKADTDIDITISFDPKTGLNFATSEMGSRTSYGAVQVALEKMYAAQLNLVEAADRIGGDTGNFQRALKLMKENIDRMEKSEDLTEASINKIETINAVVVGLGLVAAYLEQAKEQATEALEAAQKAAPETVGAGTTVITDPSPAVEVPAAIAAAVTIALIDASAIPLEATSQALELSSGIIEKRLELEVGQLEKDGEIAGMVEEMKLMYDELFDQHFLLASALDQFNSAANEVNTLRARGDRILAEREIFRKRAAAIVSGYRTRDLAFRLFRNEALEQYRTLFDLAARYSYLSAKAYDYETGLLGTEAGEDFLNDIISTRALGLLDDDGSPIFAASTNGDAGLSGLLAQMAEDWNVVRSRLGFNNPQQQGTTFSLRREKYRLLPGEEGLASWRETLFNTQRENLLNDPDVAAYCLQIGDANGLPVPGFLIEFSTTILDGYNFFGHPLAAGDRAFSPAHFATKIHSVGVILDGYIGIDADIFHQYGDEPRVVSTDPLALAANPYVYLIPCGTDIMRAPPLGDASEYRAWTVHDHAIPLPYNIGRNDASDYDFWNTADSLTENFFIPRKHSPFRAVDDTAYFYTDFQKDYTNRRLIGRSVWNTKWKLVIPARTLLADEAEAMDRFLKTVTDIRLHLKTYSYAGN